MRDVLRTGAVAGVVAALALGLIELVAALSGDGAAEAPVAGYLLALPFYWSLLVPVGMIVGLAAAAWFRCWRPLGPRELLDGARAGWRAFRDGGPGPLGWLWGSLVVGGGACAGGAALYQLYGERFHNPVLVGLLLSASILALAVALTGIARGFLRLLWRGITRLRGDRRGGWLGSPALAGGSLVVVLLGLTIAAHRFGETLIAVGISTIAWLVGLPLLLLAALAAAVATVERWRRWRRLTLGLVALPIGCLGLSVALGEVEAVQQACLAGETPATQLVAAYGALTDFDRDGASGLFGGGDCAPWNPAVGPLAVEIPGNGVDDNCVAGDSADEQLSADHKLVNAKAFYPLPPELGPRPNVVLIIVDALRADHTSLLGYARKTTPGLDRHAARAVVFERAYSQGTGTISSMPSLFTGKYPYQLKYDDDRMPPTISKRETTLAEHLAGAGYLTLGVSQIHYMLGGRWRLGQGFEHLDLSLAHKHPKADSRITSAETLEIALDLVDRGLADERPYFLWAHFYDVHGDYKPHPDQQSFGEARIDLYDGEVLFTDRHVARLLDRVLAPDQPPTVVVLCGDHGDGFESDRGRRSHAYGLFEELIHVPLVVWAPGARPRRVDTPVGNVDITPTLLNAAGLERPYLRGHSLIPYLYNGYRDPDRLVYSAKTFGRGKHKRYRKSAVGLRWKMIRWLTERKEFLFDLAEDPGEKRNVIRRHPEVAREMRRQIDHFLERNAMDTLDLEAASLR